MFPSSPLTILEHTLLIPPLVILIIGASVGPSLLLVGCARNKTKRRRVHLKKKSEASEFAIHIAQQPNNSTKQQASKETAKEVEIEAVVDRQEETATLDKTQRTPLRPLLTPPSEVASNDDSVRPKLIKDAHENASKIMDEPKTDYKNRHNRTMADTKSDFQDSEITASEATNIRKPKESKKQTAVKKVVPTQMHESSYVGPRLRT